MGLLSALGLTIIPLLARPKPDSSDILLSRATERIEKLEADAMALRRRMEGLESVVRDLSYPVQAQRQWSAEQQQQQQHMIAQLQAQQNLFANVPEGYCNCVPTRASIIA